MAVKFYRMFYKLIITYLAVGVFTLSCSRVIQPKSETEISNRHCVIHFATKVDRCLNPFLAMLKRQRVRQKSKTSRIVQTFSQKTLCLHYEEALQCLHETIQSCDTPETTTHVQERLSAPWVIPTNQLCNINMENKTTKSEAARLKVDIPGTEKVSDKRDKQIDGTAFGKHSNDNEKSEWMKTGSETVKNNDISENTSENRNDSALKFRPKSDTFIQTKTNINIYLNPKKNDKIENISIKEHGSRELAITFGQQGKWENTGTKKWKTKIGKLFFQH